MEKIKQMIKSALWVLFVAYSVVLVYVLFFSRRAQMNYPIPEYFEKFSNFVPLKTISNYIRLLPKGYVTLAWANVFGNFILFLPMGMMIPCVFKKIDRFWKVVLLNFAIILCVEMLQCVFRVGVIDVDDVILNISGAMLGYGIISIPPFAKAIRKSGIRAEKGDN